MAVMDCNAIEDGLSIRTVSNEVLPLSTDILRIEELIEFQKDQISDTSLKSCWETVGKPKSNFRSDFLILILIQYDNFDGSGSQRFTVDYQKSKKLVHRFNTDN